VSNEDYHQFIVSFILPVLAGFYRFFHCPGKNSFCHDNNPTLVTVCVEYTDLLREHYRNLTEKLDARLVAVRMYQRNALTLRDLQSIQSHRDRPVEAAETLLNIIIEQPDPIYLCFLNVLKHATGQQHIYQTLVQRGYKGQ